MSNMRQSDSNIPVVGVKILNSGKLSQNSSESKELQESKSIVNT
jgi:hypothetical protein